MSEKFVVGSVVFPGRLTTAIPPMEVGERRGKASAEISRDLVKAMAMDIGKSLVAYIEVMYPEAIKATSSTFKLSMRNHVYNDIMSIVELHDETAIRKRLADNAAHRKEWLKQWRKIRREKP